MKGAFLGDIIGSRFEFKGNKTEDFELFTKKNYFTDDTVLTVATMDSILHNIPFDESYKKWGNKYPNCGYGWMFRQWLSSEELKPYNSFGNGSAMRVSPIGWAYDDLQTVMDKSEESADVTHNHLEGEKGACSIAVCIYLSRMKTPKKIIKEFIETYFNYDLNRTTQEIKKTYRFDETCQGSVPESIICFLEGNSYEEVVRKAVGLGGDADTQGCIAGSIAEAYYGIPDKYVIKLDNYLPDEMIDIMREFYKKFKIKY